MSLVRRSLVLLVLVALVSPSPAQRGAIVAPMDLASMVDEAGIIIHGHIISARYEKHPELTNLDTIVVTVRVVEALKGSVGETYTFRQFIWDIRDRSDLAGYKKGQEVLFLLLAANEHGLSSPSGLDQGKFRIQRDAQGQAYAINGAGNRHLFNNVPQRLKTKGAQISARAMQVATRQTRGPVALDELREIIRGLVGPE
jgi:hypothetical protein